MLERESVCSRYPEVWEDTEAVSPQGWAASQWAQRNTDDSSIWHSDRTKYLRQLIKHCQQLFQSLGKPVQPHQHSCDPTWLFLLTAVQHLKPQKNQALVSISRRCFCNSGVWQTAHFPDLKWGSRHSCVMNSGLSLQLQETCCTFPHMYCLLTSLILTNIPLTSCHRFRISSLNCCWEKRWDCKGRSNYPYKKDVKKPHPQSVM